MNFEFNALSASGVLCGSAFICYCPFRDSPEEAPGEENFDWGELGQNVLAGLAVVDAVALLAAYGAAVVFTDGAALAFAPHVIGGLTAACGGAYVLGQANTDYQNQEVSSVTTYVESGLEGSIKGVKAGTAICMVPYSAGMPRR